MPDESDATAERLRVKQLREERLRAERARQQAQDRRWRWATIIGAGLLLAGCVAYRNGAFQPPEPPAPTLPPVNCAVEPPKDSVNERGEPDFQWLIWYETCKDPANQLPDVPVPPDYGFDDGGGYYDPDPDLGCPAGPRTC